MPSIFRKILFYVLFLSFAISAAAILFYSSGYRYHFEKKRIEKTGQFAIGSRPQDVDIFVDGRKVEQPFRSLFRLPLLHGKERVINILSGQYMIRLAKQGYFDWSQSISVFPGQRVILDDVRLIRRQQPGQVNEQDIGIRKIFPKTTEKKILVKEIKKEYSEKILSLLLTESPLVISDEYGVLIVKSRRGTEMIVPLPQGTFRSTRLGDISTVDWINEKEFFGFNDFEIWKYTVRADAQPEQTLIMRQSERISTPVFFDRKGFLAYVADGKKIIAVDVRQGQTIHQYTVFDGAVMRMQKNDSDELVFQGTVDGAEGVFTLRLFED